MSWARRPVRWTGSWGIATAIRSPRPRAHGGNEGEVFADLVRTLHAAGIMTDGSVALCRGGVCIVVFPAVHHAVGFLRAARSGSAGLLVPPTWHAYRLLSLAGGTLISSAAITFPSREMAGVLDRVAALLP